MSAIGQLAQQLNGGHTNGTSLVYGKITKDYTNDRKVEVQTDGLTLDESDLAFASGLRHGVMRGQRVLMLRSTDGQQYDLLLTMEGDA